MMYCKNNHPIMPTARIGCPLCERDSSVELELHINDEFAVSVAGPRETAFAEMRRYWSQYANDGKCTVYEVTRKQVPIDTVLGLAQETESSLDDRARSAFENVSAKWSTVVPWDELTEETRQHWRDHVSAKETSAEVIEMDANGKPKKCSVCGEPLVDGHHLPDLPEPF
jgi:hypothetical protein